MKKNHNQKFKRRIMRSKYNNKCNQMTKKANKANLQKKMKYITRKFQEIK
jgi:hypothetical protein